MSKHAKILLTCILKDDSELPMLKQMLKSFSPYVSGIAALLNGPSGEFRKLRKVLSRYNASIIEISPKTHPEVYYQDKIGWHFAHFAEARNILFRYADEHLSGYDWYTWADVDDVLVNPQELKDVATTAKEKGVDAVVFTYWYAIKLKPDNSFNENDVYIDQVRERLLKPKVFKWISRLHEVAVSKDDAYKPTQVIYDFKPKEGRTLVWAHMTNRDRSDINIERNLQILEIQAVEEKRKDPRTLFYLAKTYFDIGKPGYRDLAEQLLLEYLEMSGWREERGNACQYLGEIELQRNNLDKALDWYFKALSYAPYHHLAWLYISKIYAQKGMFEESDFLLDVILKMPRPQARTTIGLPSEIMFFAASMMVNRFMREANVKKALEWAKIRAKYGNDDENMVANLEELDQRNDAAHKFFDYAKWLKDTGKLTELKELLKAADPELRKEPFYQFIATEYLEPKKWEKDEIAYYASFGGPHFEQWGPESLEKGGIGGSETAVIKLAEQLAKKGWRVTVFCDCPEDIDWHGVSFRHYATMNWNDEFNVLLFWRIHHFLDRDLKAKFIGVDLHDIVSQLDWTPERMAKVNKLFVKSTYHRNYLPDVPDDKIAVISNGIDL